MATKALSVSDKLRNWWTGCSNEGLRLAERAWFAFAVRTPTTVTDVDIGDGQFLHTLSVAASPAAPPSARPLVVLHGYGQGIGVWAKAVDPLHSGLGEHGGIHLVDWLGCGLSSRPKFTASSLAETEAFFVDSLEAWRKRMGIEQFDIAGHSFGGYMAVAYTLKHPTRVASLVLVSPAGLSGSPHESRQADYSWRFRRLIGVASTFHAWGVTPHGFVKFMGSGIGRKMLARYERNGGTRRGTSEEEISLLTEYHHQVLAADSASGECALNQVLVMGAGGVSPQAPRLVEEFPLSIPLHFVYGTADWVRAVTDASLPRERDGEPGASVAADVLAGRKARAARETAPSPEAGPGRGGGGGGGLGWGLGSLQLVERGSHNMMLDEPEGTAACIIRALKAAAPVDVEAISPAVGG